MRIANLPFWGPPCTQTFWGPPCTQTFWGLDCACQHTNINFCFFVGSEGGGAASGQLGLLRLFSQTQTRSDFVKCTKKQQMFLFAKIPIFTKLLSSQHHERGGGQHDKKIVLLAPAILFCPPPIPLPLSFFWCLYKLMARLYEQEYCGALGANFHVLKARVAYCACVRGGVNARGNREAWMLCG